MESVLNSSLRSTTTTARPRPSPYVCNKTSSCGCGQTDVALSSTRIVGGEDAVDSSWPMMVSLRITETALHSCGGTIVSNSFILTAAHCFRRISTEHPVGVTIAVGMTNRSDCSREIRTVDRIILHPNFNTTGNDHRHDIALLHIDRPLRFESDLKVSQTCIHRPDLSKPPNEYPTSGTRLAIVGWGTLKYGTSLLPEILQQAEVIAIDNQYPACRTVIDDVELQFCAGLLEGGKGQ